MKLVATYLPTLLPYLWGDNALVSAILQWLGSGKVGRYLTQVLRYCTVALELGGFSLLFLSGSQKEESHSCPFMSVSCIQCS